MQGTARRLADLDSIRDARTRHHHADAAGSMRGRVYEPERRTTRTALLVSGLHPSGHRRAATRPDRPPARVERHRPSSRRTSPSSPRFDVSPALTDAIEHAAVWLANDSGLAPTHHIGLFGDQLQRRSVDCRRRTTIARRSRVARPRVRRPRRSAARAAVSVHRPGAISVRPGAHRARRVGGGALRRRRPRSAVHARAARLRRRGSSCSAPPIASSRRHRPTRSATPSVSTCWRPRSTAVCDKSQSAGRVRGAERAHRQDCRNRREH